MPAPGGLFAVRATVTSELVDVSPCAKMMSEVTVRVPENPLPSSAKVALPTAGPVTVADP